MREWLVIENSMKNGIFVSAEVRDEKGYIPRDVAEAICGRSMAGPQWFTREESEKMRAHPEWRDTEPPPLTESTRPPMNDDLIARLERATEGSRELDAEVWREVSLPTEYFGSKIERVTYSNGDVVIDTEDGFRHFDTHDIPRFTLSLDAALSLVPGGKWQWQIRQDPSSYRAGIVGGKIPDMVIHRGQAPTPALALCIAALRARG